MPTYDYKCMDCGHVFEAFQSIKADPLSQCPECQGTVKRQIGTGAGILFKGSGFYQTDYRSDAYQKEAKKDSPQAAKETKKDPGNKSSGSSDKSPPAKSSKDESSKNKTSKESS